MKWISVKDEMPHYGIVVLAYPTGYGFYQTNRVEALTVFNDGKGNGYFEGHYGDNEITHWMYLPKPPKTN